MYKSSEDLQYRRFLDALLDTQTVYTLSDENGVAECPSTEYNATDGEPVSVLCYWSSVENAQDCRSEEWSSYQIEAVSLAEFMRTWLLNMDEDECLVGVEFDADLYGLEIEPIELLADLMDAAQERGIEFDIHDYEALVAYRLEWERMVAGQTLLN